MGVVVKTYSTIYELIDEVKDLLEGTALSEEKKVKGRAQIIKIFKLESGDKVLGCKIEFGKFKEKSRIAIYDKNPTDIQDLMSEALYIGSVKKIKVGRDDAAEISKGKECGILLRPQFDDVQKEMWIEVL